MQKDAKSERGPDGEPRLGRRRRGESSDRGRQRLQPIKCYSVLFQWNNACEGKFVEVQALQHPAL